MREIQLEWNSARCYCKEAQSKREGACSIRDLQIKLHEAQDLVNERRIHKRLRKELLERFYKVSPKSEDTL